MKARVRTGASLWFCGPMAWGDAPARALGKGADAPVFHRELFEFR